MNLKSVGMVVGAFSAIGSVVALGFWVAADSKREKNIREYAESAAEVAFSDELKEKSDRYLDLKRKADNIRNLEGEKFRELYAKWDLETGTNLKMKEIFRELDEKMATWDKENNYRSKTVRIDNEFCDAIKAWKEQNRFDETISECNKKISDAKSQYDAQKSLSKSLGKVNENFEDGANEIKKAAKKIRDDVVSENQQKIADIRKELNDFTSKMSEKAKEEHKKLDDIRDKVFSEYEKAREEALKPYRDATRDAREKFMKEAKSKRTPEDDQIFEDCKVAFEELRVTKTKISEKAENLIKEATYEDKLACALDDMGITPGLFVFLASMPVIFVSGIMVKYVVKAKNIYYIMKHNIVAA